MVILVGVAGTSCIILTKPEFDHLNTFTASTSFFCKLLLRFVDLPPIQSETIPCEDTYIAVEMLLYHVCIIVCTVMNQKCVHVLVEKYAAIYIHIRMYNYMGLRIRNLFQHQK